MNGTSERQHSTRGRFGRVAVVMLAAALTMPIAASPVQAADTAAAPAPTRTSAERTTSAADARRGLVLAGLRRAWGGPCKGLYRVDAGPGKPGCTAGPDLAPAGIDVTDYRSTSEIRLAVAHSRLAHLPARAARLGTRVNDVLNDAGVPCIGDGTSGSRIQMIYAVARDKTDRYDSLLGTFSKIAAQMDAALALSAAETGGERHFRFVTTPDCALDVKHVVLSATGDDTLADMIAELKALGYDDAGRKYHVWMDANIYCGIGQLWPDDSPATTNANASSISYARSDTGCWGYSEIHEVFHGLGAIQKSAPNASGNYHCDDEYDVMCYLDSSGTPMRKVCAASHDTLLDCNHDDYFNTDPAAGSYLATHWNTANSPFLSSGHIDSPKPTPTPEPTPTPDPESVAQVVESGTTGKAGAVRQYTLVIGAGRPLANLVFTSPSGTNAKLQVRLRAPSGEIVASKTGRSPVKLAVGLPAGTWTYEVVGKVRARFTLKVTYPIP